MNSGAADRSVGDNSDSANGSHGIERTNGTLTTWHDERGYGFISPEGGGGTVFVHISAFEERWPRPTVGLPLTFELVTRPDGKISARQVQLVLTSQLARERKAIVAKRQSAGSYLIIVVFLAMYILLTVLWMIPFWVTGLYLVASLLCYLVYATDKSAAVAGKWRISERTLIIAGLLGGWPGAIFAQQVLRHKTRKSDFIAAFYGSVIINIVAFVTLSSPLVRHLFM